MDGTVGTAAIGLRVAYPPAIVNAVSFAPSAVSPGEIVTIFGSNLGPAKLVGAQLDSTGKKLNTSVAGTQIFFDNDPAPVVYTSAGQVSVVVPYSVAGKTSVNMIPFYNGALQDAIPINVAPSALGILRSTASRPLRSIRMAVPTRHPAHRARLDYCDVCDRRGPDQSAGPGRPARYEPVSQTGASGERHGRREAGQSGLLWGGTG